MFKRMLALISLIAILFMFFAAFPVSAETYVSEEFLSPLVMSDVNGWRIANGGGNYGTVTADSANGQLVIHKTTALSSTVSAMRYFPAISSKIIKISTRIKLEDQKVRRAIMLRTDSYTFYYIYFNTNGSITSKETIQKSLGYYTPGCWYDVEIVFNAETGRIKTTVRNEQGTVLNSTKDVTGARSLARVSFTSDNSTQQHKTYIDYLYVTKTAESPESAPYIVDDDFLTDLKIDANDGWSIQNGGGSFGTATADTSSGKLVIDKTADTSSTVTALRSFEAVSLGTVKVFTRIKISDWNALRTIKLQSSFTTFYDLNFRTDRSVVVHIPGVSSKKIYSNMEAGKWYFIGIEYNIDSGDIRTTIIGEQETPVYSEGKILDTQRDINRVAFSADATTNRFRTYVDYLKITVDDARDASDLVYTTGTVVDERAHDWNPQSYDQDRLITYGGYQYTAYWDEDYTLAVARIKPSDGSVQKISFVDTVGDPSDGHFNISIGICPSDGTFHVSYGHHVTPHHYRRTGPGWITNPPATISTSQFTNQIYQVQSPYEDEQTLTYPRFFNDNSGNLYFTYRRGTSGGGDVWLHRYHSDMQTWSSIGRLFQSYGYYNGSVQESTSRNAYIDNILFDKNDRLHVTWTWREGYGNTGHITNHDICYAYSDDYGKTWKNNDGEYIATLDPVPTKGNSIVVNTPGIVVISFPQKYWHLNQNSMELDSFNQPHIFAQRSTWEADTIEGANVHYIHYFRNTSGVWQEKWMTDTSIICGQMRKRGQIVIDKADNCYFIYSEGEELKCMKSSAADNWSTYHEYNLLDGVDIPGSHMTQGWVYDRKRFYESDRTIVSVPSIEKISGVTNFAVRQFAITNAVEKAWEFGSDMQEWSARKSLGNFRWVSGGRIEGNITGSDPGIISNSNLGININTAKTVKIKLKNSTSDTNAQLYFITDADMDWNQAKSKTFTILPNSDYTEYTIDLSDIQGWNGVLNTLRIDPASSAASGSFGIEYIRIQNPSVPYYNLVMVGNDNAVYITASGYPEKTVVCIAANYKNQELSDFKLYQIPVCRESDTIKIDISEMVQRKDSVTKVMLWDSIAKPSPVCSEIVIES